MNSKKDRVRPRIPHDVALMASESPIFSNSGTFADGHSPEIRVLIGHDDPLINGGLSMLIDGHEGMKVVEQCNGAQKAIEKYFECCPHVALLGLGTKDSRQAVYSILHNDPECRVIVLTSSDSEEIFYEAFRAGVRGYLLTDAPLKDLFAAVQSVGKGGMWISPSLKYTLSKRMLEVEPRAGNRNAIVVESPQVPMRVEHHLADAS
jgi:DNA-binding NarL/FixJ family response regulator